MIFFRRNNGYKLIDNPNLDVLNKKYSNTWKDETFPEKQWRRVERQLQNINRIPEFQAIVDCVKGTRLTNPSILEVGCSSGYHSEVLKKAGIKARYSGTDYSPDFIEFAKEKYPNVEFCVGDAVALKYRPKSFDIVISGCCLLHIINYQKAISESARVAGKYVIFHRTPIIHIQATTYTTKTAYDQQMLEIIFNEQELVDQFRKNKLAIIKVETYNRFSISGISEPIFMKDYLTKRL